MLYVFGIIIALVVAALASPVATRATHMYRDMTNAKLDFIARTDRYAYENYGNDPALLAEINQYTRYVVDALTKHCEDVPTLIDTLNDTQPEQIVATVLQYRNT